ncbi:MAG: peptidase domain-containing ABC transporter [Cytophagales bacterium]|nr:MAG: peptidase domain-containing ABC transporter [Cytophagales bacterium]
MKPRQHLQRTLVRQQDQSDCGVACLASLLRYYGSEARLERLRELSGTNRQGTSMLGLYQTANALGFEAEGMQADSVENLITDVSAPVILHITLIDETTGQQLEHYVVCYGWDAAEGQFLIGDPARGVVTYTRQKLADVWKSRILLTLAPTERLSLQADQKRLKRQWLLGLLRSDVPLLAMATGLGVLTAGLGLSTAIFSQKLLDEILPKHDTKRLLLGMGLLAVLLLARAGSVFLRGFLLNRQSRDFNNRLVQQFFDTLLYLPKSFFDNRRTGELIARLNDTARIQRSISYLTGAVVINLLLLLVCAGYIFTYSVPLGWATLLCMPLYGGLIWRYDRIINQAQQAVMVASAHNESHYVDTLQGIDVIKVNNQQPFFSGLTARVYANYQQKLYDLGLIGLRVNLVAEVLGAILLSGLLAGAAWLVLGNTLKIGEMMAVLTLIGNVFPAVGALALTNLQVQEAGVAFDRMYDYVRCELEQQPTETPQTSSPIDSLQVKNLCFGFPGCPLLLDSLSFHLTKGELITIVGENGRGKSTLLQILQRFYQPESGSVWANGQAWTSWSVADWRSQLGVVPQSIKVFNGTVLENIGLQDTHERPEAVVQFCEAWGFAPFFEALPQSYLTLIGENGVQLSGGQQQLLALARALYRQPSLLLLDEPTASLDSETSTFVLKTLESCRQKMGILVITHKADLADLSDRTYQLIEGQLQEFQGVSSLTVF